MMKSLTLLSAIASGYLMTLGTPAYGQDLSLPPIEEPSLAPLPAELSPINTETDGENSFLEALSNEPSPVETVGLRINESRIVTAFHGSLIRYVGDCPGTHWFGNATRDNVRFISHTVPPAKDLRVSLINLTSGQSITRKYTKEDKGSTDFQVIRLGIGNGDQNIQYRIFNKNDETVLEEGEFTYELSTDSYTRYRNGDWHSELFCASDKSHAIKDCDIIGKQDRLYCEGYKTGHIINQSHFKRRHPIKSRRVRKSHNRRLNSKSNFKEVTSPLNSQSNFKEVTPPHKKSEQKRQSHRQNSNLKKFIAPHKKSSPQDHSEHQKSQPKRVVAPHKKSSRQTPSKHQNQSPKKVMAPGKKSNHQEQSKHQKPQSRRVVTPHKKSR